MLRIEEIVGAMDDDFRDALEELSTERLTELGADKRALDKFRPVGVSHTEAMAMIAHILDVRANPPPPPEPEPEPEPTPAPIPEPEPEPACAPHDPNAGPLIPVMAGLDPAIHADEDTSNRMDTRVKPEGDAPSIPHPGPSVSEPPDGTASEPPARSLALPLTLAALIAAALLFRALL